MLWFPWQKGQSGVDRHNAAEWPFAQHFVQTRWRGYEMENSGVGFVGTLRPVAAAADEAREESESDEADKAADEAGSGK